MQAPTPQTTAYALSEKPHGLPDKARISSKKAGTPESKERTPDSKTRTPDSTARTSEPKARTSEPKARTLESKTRTPESTARTPEKERTPTAKPHAPVGKACPTAFRTRAPCIPKDEPQLSDARSRKNPRAPPLPRFRCICSYEAVRTVELTIAAGEMFVMCEEGVLGWDKVTNVRSGRSGLVPKAYLQRVEPEKNQYPEKLQEALQVLIAGKNKMGRKTNKFLAARKAFEDAGFPVPFTSKRPPGRPSMLIGSKKIAKDF